VTWVAGAAEQAGDVYRETHKGSDAGAYLRLSGAVTPPQAG
jgi:hypothetical protein